MSAKTKSYKLASLTLAAGLPLLALTACGRHLDSAANVLAGPTASGERLSTTLPRNANMRLVAERIDAAIANEMISDGKVHISARRLKANQENPIGSKYWIAPIMRQLMADAFKDATGKTLAAELHSKGPSSHSDGVPKMLAAKAIARGLAFHPDNRNDLKRMHGHVLTLLSELRTDNSDKIESQSGDVQINADDDSSEIRRCEYFAFLNQRTGVFVQILTVEGH